MKHFKRLGLLAVATAAMMSFATSASADYLSTSTGGAAATPTIHEVSEGHITLKNPIANISCNSTSSFTPNSHGAGKPVSGPVNVLTFTGCTNSWHVTVINAGSLSIEHTSGHNGTASSTGAKVETTRFGIKCVYETNNTHIGVVEGGTTARKRIKILIVINLGESSGLCGSSNASVEGDYVTTSGLYVNNS